MRSQGIEYSDALVFTDGERGFGVKTLFDLEEGELIACIPKTACLTIKTSAARKLIEEMELDGALGLAVAIMYEKSIGEKSTWYGYLQFLPEKECVPLLWSSEEIDTFLVGTELHKIVKEDKKLVCQDWKECIRPLLDDEDLKLDPCHFGVEQYFFAKSLIASRSFEVDDYHGFGMVPLADIFNHKTGAEDVHFTLTSYSSDAEEEESSMDLDQKSTPSHSDGPSRNSDLNANDGNIINHMKDSTSSSPEEFPEVLEMIMVRDVKAECEVFNTYGNLGNAALLHRYGFTEPDNPFDIVNMDLGLVCEWSSSSFSSRYSRSRLSTWRKIGFSGCVSEKSEYFEISSCGQPQPELVVLLYVMCLPENAYTKLCYHVPPFEDRDDALKFQLFGEIIDTVFGRKITEKGDWMLTGRVCDALISLANMRERLYGSTSLLEDMESLSKCLSLEQPKLHGSLSLRISERTILGKLRTYANHARRKRKHVSSS
ncbi:Ribosomal lysine N-methyltransferase 3 [Nymphaea thermarum]|nr:Ribosomal lysine N-methyltransferase 3 [Nymphaea thermarum]